MVRGTELEKTDVRELYWMATKQTHGKSEKVPSRSLGRLGSLRMSNPPAHHHFLRSGLEGQLLGVTIQHEQPELEKAKSEMLRQEEGFKVRKTDAWCQVQSTRNLTPVRHL